MPIYEYRCGGCGHELEELQKVSDAALTDCPACNEPRLTKLVSAAGFQLKGTGWYQTDFRGKRGGKSDGKSDGTSEGASGPAAGEGAACAPEGCAKPGCAAKTDAA